MTNRVDVFGRFAAVMVLVVFAGQYTAARAEGPAAADEAWNIYFGDIHQHSTFSDGDVEPEALLRKVRESGVVDFMALSDHSQYFDSPEDWKASKQWAELKRLADQYNEDGKFVAMAAFEWSKNSQAGGSGHMNTFATEWFASADAKYWKSDVKSYYRRLAKDLQAFAMFNHPGVGQYNRFGDFSAEFDPHVTLFEIATRSNRKEQGKPRLAAYMAALDKGWHLAPADNTDSHKGFWWIDNCFGQTAVLAKQLTREAVYDALRHRRAYATYDRNLRMSFTVNGQIMGSILDRPESLELVIEVSDPDPGDTIQTIDVLVDGGKTAATKRFDSETARWTLRLEPACRYCLLRVVQADGNLAFSAPVWRGH